MEMAAAGRGGDARGQIVAVKSALRMPPIGGVDLGTLQRTCMISQTATQPHMS